MVESMGLRLWDVRFEKEGADWYLKVVIDRDDPMDTDTCEAVSRAIDPLLDEADPIEQSYCLEVGSPGLGRKLTRPEHFTAMLGQKVAARLYKPDEAGRKEITGILTAFEDGTATLETEDGPAPVPLKAAGSFRLCDDENLFG
ncbi:ribosome maturation factor RimP [Ruminococcaceae bacterium OttesenSCG-928-D13]|nr:ribosome maturation factor RimP [Ruminococcaceae bacterium OttesenSCG-928-D13]